MKVPYTRKSIFTTMIFCVFFGIISALLKVTIFADVISDMTYNVVTGAIIGSVVVLFILKPKP